MMQPWKHTGHLLKMIRGELYWADYGVPYGSEPGFRRPVLIIQDDEFNVKELRTVLVIPLTTNINLANAPANVFLSKNDSELPKDSVAVISQTGVIDKARLTNRISKVPLPVMREIEDSLRWIYGLD